MMNHHRTFSARTETIRNLWRHLLVLAIGSAISLAAFGAYGMESPRAPEAKQGAFTGLPLPPIPYLNTMPWLIWKPATATMKVDTLLPSVTAPWGIRPEPKPPTIGLPTTS